LFAATVAPHQPVAVGEPPGGDFLAAGFFVEETIFFVQHGMGERIGVGVVAHAAAAIEAAHAVGPCVAVLEALEMARENGVGAVLGRQAPGPGGIGCHGGLLKVSKWP
jgi:hypothetical protein